MFGKLLQEQNTEIEIFYRTVEIISYVSTVYHFSSYLQQIFHFSEGLVFQLSKENSPTFILEKLSILRNQHKTGGKICRQVLKGSEYNRLSEDQNHFRKKV